MTDNTARGGTPARVDSMDLLAESSSWHLWFPAWLQAAGAVVLIVITYRYTRLTAALSKSSERQLELAKEVAREGAKPRVLFSLCRKTPDSNTERTVRTVFLVLENYGRVPAFDLSVSRLKEERWRASTSFPDFFRWPIHVSVLMPGERLYFGTFSIVENCDFDNWEKDRPQVHLTYKDEAGESHGTDLALSWMGRAIPKNDR